MNNALKAAVRKHAIAAGMATAGWDDEQIAKYAEDNGITAKGNHSKAAPKKKPEIIVDQPEPETAEKPEGKGGVEKAIEDLVKEMGLQQEVALDEGRVVELIQQHSRKVTITVDNKKTGETNTIEGGHYMTETVMQCIAAGVNVAAVGPAGSGKSTIFQLVAEGLGLDYYLTGAVQQEHKILGYEDANGTYHRTPFRDAYENGGLFVFEEYDGSSARALLTINNAVANEFTDFPDGIIKKHPDFVCVMAGNTFGMGASRQYVGRQQLDAATLDRFAFVEIGYDEGLERAITLAHNENAGAWVDTVQAFRAKVEQAGLRHVVSPRASIMGAKLLKQGMDHVTVTKLVLHKGLSQDQIKQVA